MSTCFGAHNENTVIGSGFEAQKMSRGQPTILIDSRRLERSCIAAGLRAGGLDVVEAVAPNDTHLSEYYASSCVVVMFSKENDVDVRREIATVLRLCESAAVLVMSTSDSLNFAMSAIESGARGYVPSSSSLAELMGAIHLAQSGGVYVPVSCVMAARKQEPEQPSHPRWQDRFTARQAAVIECIRLGKPNKIIAYELNMCESTVKVHIRNVMKKLRVRNRTELAFRATDTMAA